MPNVARIATALRDAGGTVIWARCRSLTADARDNGRRFHDFGIFVACDSPEAELIDGVVLEHGDVLLDKTTASVFLSTNLNVMLRQMGVKSLITTGVVTSGCVESTVRDGCDHRLRRPPHRGRLRGPQRAAARRLDRAAEQQLRRRDEHQRGARQPWRRAGPGRESQWQIAMPGSFGR